MYEIIGFIDGIIGRLQFDPSTNWLKFTSPQEGDKWGRDAAGTMTFNFEAKTIRVADRLMESADIDGDEEVTLTIQAGMQRYGKRASNSGVRTTAIRSRPHQSKVAVIADKVKSHGTNLHIANLTLLWLNLLALAANVFFYLSTGISFSSKVSTLTILAVAAVFVFLGYVAIEFIIQLGLLFAAWTQDD
jgi:hypothetical protein